LPSGGFKAQTAEKSNEIMEETGVKSESDSDEKEGWLSRIDIDVLEEEEEVVSKRLEAKAFKKNLENASWRISNQLHHDVGRSLQTLDVGERSVRFIVDPELGQQFRAWDCSLVLCKYLQTYMQGYLPGKKVLELGCGLGLPGLVSAELGASNVILTDLEIALPIVEENIQLNNYQECARFQTLQWGEGQDLALLPLPLDLVLCSDLVYTNRESVELLVDTLRDCTALGTTILSCHENRYGATTTPLFLKLLRQYHFEYEQVKLSELDNSWKDDERIVLIKINRLSEEFL